MRVLLVSRSLPKDLRTYVSGSFQRLAVFIEAIGPIADLDMLFYVHPDTDVSPGAVAAMERSLSAHWNVDIHLSICPRSQFDERASKWERYVSPALNFFKQPGYRDTSGPRQVAAFETCLSRKPDAIFVQGLDSMCPALLTSRPLPPLLFDLNDIEHVALARGIERSWSWRDKIIQYARLPALCWGERRAMRLARTVFVCSETDRAYLTNWWRLPQIATIPNAVRAAKLLPVTAEPTLLLLGAYWYKPNVDAATFLVERVWPRVRQSLPQARLTIAGVSPESIPCYGRGIPGVEFTGFVDDLEALYARTRVVCAPILSGGGTRLKIVEAASYGRAIVSTRIGAEGLNFLDGRELLLRDDAESFASACLELLADSVRCEQMGSAAHAAVREHYLREKVTRRIQSHFALSQPSPRLSQRIGEAAKL